MAKPSLIDQLDQAVETILTRPDAVLPPADPKLVPLLPIAAELRDLPREEFRARLKADLERKTSMTTKVKSTREGFHSLTPYLVVTRPEQYLDFLKQAFGAEETRRTTGTAGGLHVEVRIGDSMVMMGGGEGIAPIPAALHLYVRDADGVYRRALQAGAASFYELMDQPYGDREGGVKDPSGNVWYIATHKATGHRPEGLRSVTPVLHPRGADKLINFLKQAFAAEEGLCEKSPDGTVVHAQVRIGDSLMEVGEAHGPIQPMPCMIHLYVDDTDALYQRALAAGASSIEKPADQTYGDRRAGVRDPFGNQWYIATHIQDVPL